MDDKVQFYRQQIIDLRKKLAEVERRRSQYEHSVPTEVWQELADISHSLDLAEGELIRINQETAAELNNLRDEIVATLAQYNHWRAQMLAIEKLFLVNILRPGYSLKQAIRRREYLDQEYWRMRAAIESGGYSSLEELEADIRRVLAHGQSAFEADERSFLDEQLQETTLREIPKKINLDELVDEFEKEALLREFKRVVLPAVHPDTSDTPEEVFNTVFETYEQQDYLLMEAYIVEYRGEIEPDPENDPLETQDRLAKTQAEYHRLSGRLERRVAYLKKELTPQELEDPIKVENELRGQRQELLERIQAETERIFNLNEKIEGLVQLYREHYPGAIDEQ